MPCTLEIDEVCERFRIMESETFVNLEVELEGAKWVACQVIWRMN